MDDHKERLRERYDDLHDDQILDTPARTLRGVLTKMQGFYDESERPILRGESDLGTDDLPLEYSASIY